MRHAESIEAEGTVKGGHTIPLIGGAGARYRYE